jgi:hypothetical protein
MYWRFPTASRQDANRTQTGHPCHSPAWADLVSSWWMYPGRTILVAFLVSVLAAACTSSAEGDGRAPGEASSPAPVPSSTPVHPVLYFNLTEDDALAYLGELDRRIEEALHDGDLGALQDLYVTESLAARRMAGRIIRNFRQGLVDRLRYEVLDTRVLMISSQLAVFRQVRLAVPCVYTFAGHKDATPDPRVMRQVVIRYMADERLNWRIEREVVRSAEPTGENAPCPP